MDNIYLDYAATTPLDHEVFEKMEPYFFDDFGNPSSSHYFGQRAEAAVENARHTIAQILDASGEEVYFTGSGSEGDNLAVRGAALEMRKKKKANKILISPVEHSAVSNTTYQLKTEFDFEFEELRIDKYGIIDQDFLHDKLKDNVALVSVVYANNEIGSINPLKEIAEICNSRGVLLHSDAVQACAHLYVKFHAERLDLLTLTAHKFYGPKGVGAILCRKGVELMPQITGGKQEKNLRAGTQNVPGIVGMAEALVMKNQEMIERNQRLSVLRDRIIDTILLQIPGSQLTGHPRLRLPNHTSFVFDGISGNDLVIALDMAGFACSSGSACKVGDPKPSKVLLALGLPTKLALGSLRVTLGRNTTSEQVDRFLDTLPRVVARLRK